MKGNHVVMIEKEFVFYRHSTRYHARGRLDALGNILDIELFKDFLYGKRVPNKKTIEVIKDPKSNIPQTLRKQFLALLE